MSETIQVTIDRDECIQCGVCWVTCEEVFGPGDDGLSQIMPDYQVDGNPSEGQIPPALEACATEGADGCPVAIIHVG